MSGQREATEGPMLCRNCGLPLVHIVVASPQRHRDHPGVMEFIPTLRPDDDDQEWRHAANGRRECLPAGVVQEFVQCCCGEHHARLVLAPVRAALLGES